MVALLRSSMQPNKLAYENLCIDVIGGIMKGLRVAIPGAVVSLIGWWGPWLDFGENWMRGDLLVRDGLDRYGPNTPLGTDPQPYIILLLICYAGFLGLTTFSAVRNNRLALALAGIIAIFIVLLELFFFVNTAVFAYAWQNKFILVWQWGVLVMFGGIALMIWGMFTAWVDREVDQT